MLRDIVLPQALQVMLPSFVNQWVTLVKDSSLAYIVGVGELSFVAAPGSAGNRAGVSACAVSSSVTPYNHMRKHSTRRRTTLATIDGPKTCLTLAIESRA